MDREEKNVKRWSCLSKSSQYVVLQMAVIKVKVRLSLLLRLLYLPTLAMATNLLSIYPHGLNCPSPGLFSPV